MKIIEVSDWSKPATSRYTLERHLENATDNNFNLLRLVAAIAVVFGDSFALSLNRGSRSEPLQSLLGFTYSGSIAVDVFFLVSGVFVSHSLFNGRNTIDFVLKRFFRIWPGLAVCLLVTVALLVIIDSDISSKLIESPSLYSYILNNSILRWHPFIDGVFQSRQNHGLNGSLWTLPLRLLCTASC